MVHARQKVKFGIFVAVLVTLAVSIRHDTVGCAMNKNNGSGILKGYLIDRQRLGGYKVIAADMYIASWYGNDFRDIASIIGCALHLSTERIITKNSHRSAESDTADTALEPRKRLEIIWKIEQIMLIVEVGIVKFRAFIIFTR